MDASPGRYDSGRRQGEGRQPLHRFRHRAVEINPVDSNVEHIISRPAVTLPRGWPEVDIKLLAQAVSGGSNFAEVVTPESPDGAVVDSANFYERS